MLRRIQERTERRTKPRTRTEARELRIARGVLLAAAAVLGALAALEVGLRLFYRGGVPTSVTASATSEAWKKDWIERHRQSGTQGNASIDQYHPLFGWSIKPNLNRYQSAGHPPVTSNAQGWRAERDYVYERRAGVARLVVLGDSFTFGEQARDQDVWPVQLERQLDGTEVLNLAVRGYGTDQQLRVLEEEGVLYRPDVVVLGFFVEDVLRNGQSFRDYAKPMFVLSDRGLVLTNSPVPPPSQILAEQDDTMPKSYLVDFVRGRLGRFAGGELADLHLGDDLFRLTRAILQRMRDVTAEHGGKLLVVVIPSRRRVPGIEAALEAWAPEVGYAIVDVTEALTTTGRMLDRSVYDGFYLTTLSDFVMATRVRETLVRLGWVREPGEGTLAQTEDRRRALVAAGAKPVP